MGIFKKHLLGWHERRNMENDGYFDHWKKKVEQEEEKGNQVVVVTIPKGSDKLTIEDLEAFIQGQLE